MSAARGWYPDPGGQQGMFRYWDGAQWSQALSPTPAAPPPGADGPAADGAASGSTGGRRSPVWPWVLGGVALVVVLVVIAGFSLTRGGTGINPNLNPGGPGTSDPCPPQPTALASPAVQDVPGRVRGGPLSYPQLGGPWGPVDTSENRLAFGRDVAKQDVMVEQNYNGNQSWVASLLVAELQAGDGFYSPESGTEIVARCVVGAFYGDAAVQRDDVRDEALTVDGREAWVLESHLSFDIPNLQTKGELLIIVIVKIDDFRAGIYYASIPDTVPELVPDARRAMDELRVEE